MIFLCLAVLAFAVSWLQISMIKNDERVPSWKVRKGIQVALLALALAIFLFDPADPASRMLFVLMTILCVIPPQPRHSFFGHLAGLADWIPMIREAMRAARQPPKTETTPGAKEPDGPTGH